MILVLVALVRFSVISLFPKLFQSSALSLPVNKEPIDIPFYIGQFKLAFLYKILKIEK